MQPHVNIGNRNQGNIGRYLEEVFHEGDSDLLDEMVADDFLGRKNAVLEPYHGPEGMKEFARTNRIAYPDLEGTIEDVIELMGSKRSGNEPGAVLKTHGAGLVGVRLLNEAASVSYLN